MVSMAPRPLEKFLYHRLTATLAIQRRQLQDLTSRLPVTHRHALYVLNNQRTGSTALLDAIRKELGEPGWLFVVGASNVLTDEGGDHAA